MKIIYTILGLLLFILMLGFALKNADPVELHYYLGYVWRAPLSLMLLMTFCGGALVGIIACLPTWIRQRRRLIVLQRELHNLNSISSEKIPKPAEST
jgi:lipopolysaccharide assembly protein A